LAACLLTSLALAQDLPASPESLSAASGFRFRAGAIPVGRVHFYRKSNLDRTNPSEIALFLAAESRLEALKWHAGEPEATLVQATLDWDRFSVQRFETFAVTDTGAREKKAEIATSSDGKTLTATVGTRVFTCALERFPWHSYDFDFASLNVALRFLVDPRGEVEFDIVDPSYGPGGPSLENKGPVVLAYRGEEEHNGLPCRRYTLDGPGLLDRGGSLWASKGDEIFLVAFELDLPDEPGMTSGRLEWLRNETLSSAEWGEFVLRRKRETR
jgi:hypothetical protein